MIMAIKHEGAVYIKCPLIYHLSSTFSFSSIVYFTLYPPQLPFKKKLFQAKRYETTSIVYI